MPDAPQLSFAAGELSEELRFRSDLQKYGIGAAKLRNFFVDYRGGVVSRPGTEFIGNTWFRLLDSRLIPFEFSTEQTYVLEFGHLHMRVIRDGGYVLEAAKAINSLSQANPGVMNVTSHGWSDGDTVFLSGVTGMTEVNNRFFWVNVLTANTMELLDVVDGSAINTSSWDPLTGGSAARVYTLTTTFTQDELDNLKFVQANDVMTLTHVNHPPKRLTRTGHASWTISTANFASSIASPVISSVTTSGGAGSTEYEYVVTAISSATGDESLPSAVGSVVTQAFSAATLANTVNWGAISGAAHYNVYRAPWVDGENVPADSLYGLIGTTRGTTLIDNNITADFSRGPPDNNNPFSAET